MPFQWTATAHDAFVHLKSVLTQAPVLIYPDILAIASPFVLQTDASVVGAVLEQGGHVIAYASCTLTKTKSNYSVIQKRFSYYIWYETILPLSLRLLFYINDRSCTTPTAIGSKDGRLLCC